jgi:hypothetical protein
MPTSRLAALPGPMLAGFLLVQCKPDENFRYHLVLY